MGHRDLLVTHNLAQPPSHPPLGSPHAQRPPRGRLSSNGVLGRKLFWKSGRRYARKVPGAKPSAEALVSFFQDPQKRGVELSEWGRGKVRSNRSAGSKRVFILQDRKAKKEIWVYMFPMDHILLRSDPVVCIPFPEQVRT
jgi:hypothetical protein